MTARAPLASDAYTFASKPRPLASASRKKYRDQDGSTDASVNLMFDRRVFRGNTYDLSMLNGLKSDGTVDANVERVPIIPSVLQKTIFDISVPPPPRVPVDLSSHLTNVTRHAVTTSIDAQTDAFFPRPPSPPYVPLKTGIDVQTQIEDGELFDFDWEVAPIVSVVVNKTLEQALLEVEEETELASIAAFKAQHAASLASRKEEERQALLREKQILAEHNLNVRLARERHIHENEIRRRCLAQSIGKNFTSSLFRTTINSLQKAGFNSTKEELATEQEFMPWLFAAVEENLANIDAIRSVVDHALDRSITYPLREHSDIINSRKATELAAWKKKNEVLKGNIRVFVSGYGPEPVGPIPVTNRESVSIVEGRIIAWLHANAPDIAISMAGGIDLLVNGSPLLTTATLFELSPAQQGSVEIRPRVAAPEESSSSD